MLSRPHQNQAVKGTSEKQSEQAVDTSTAFGLSFRHPDYRAAQKSEIKHYLTSFYRQPGFLKTFVSDHRAICLDVCLLLERRETNLSLTVVNEKLSEFFVCVIGSGNYRVHSLLSEESLFRASTDPTFASEERQPRNCCFSVVDRTAEAFLIPHQPSSAGAHSSGTAPYYLLKERQQKTGVFVVSRCLPCRTSQGGLGEP